MSGTDLAYANTRFQRSSLTCNSASGHAEARYCPFWPRRAGLKCPTPYGSRPRIRLRCPRG
eukprot:438469-Rhodomonas_salina.1